MAETKVKRRGPGPTVQVLGAIWRDQYPPGQTKDRTVIEKVLLSVPLIPRIVSPVWLGAAVFCTERSWSNWVDAYVILWTGGLLVMLLMLTPAGWWTPLVVFLAGWRIVDILSYSISVI